MEENRTCLQVYLIETTEEHYSKYNDILKTYLRRNPLEVRVTSGQKLCTEIIYIVLKLLCDCFKYLLERDYF